ncbi:helix-turn-helix transcriptional regulator [Lachnospiraceae bacterium ZAX-1]
MEQNKPLSVQEAAGVLYISRNTVYDLIRKNELASYRVGRKVRIDMQAIEDYKNKSRTGANVQLIGSLHTPMVSTSVAFASAPTIATPYEAIILSGQDMLLDILTQYLLRPPYNFRALRSYVGSFDGILDVYRGKATIASVHLWDGTTDEYNLPFVRYMLPGIPCRLINFAYRMQGFYVAKGNPKNIQTWEDLVREDVTMLNREIGCGVRVLIDESLQQHGISHSQIKGYRQWDKSHLAVASAVSRGEADVSVGNQKSSRQVENIDFIPLKKERLDLCIPKSTPEPYQAAVVEILNSQAFRNEVSGIGGYDISQMGTLIAET